MSTANIADIKTQLSSCEQCQRRISCTRPVGGIGKPEAKVMFVGESPDRDSDLEGRPYSGRAGELLRGLIDKSGLDRRIVYVTYLVKCKGEKIKRVDGDACKKWLWKEMQALRPQVIVPMGNLPARILMSIKSNSVTKYVNQIAAYPESFGFPGHIVPIYAPEFLVTHSGKAVQETIKTLTIIKDMLK